MGVINKSLNPSNFSYLNTYVYDHKEVYKPMKRTYAFEADASAEVKDELEKVETVVDEKCESVEDCEKLEEKIEKVEDKFNDALQGMADAAKEGGDKEELKEKIDPHMADLKEIAKDIGVATESEVVTDQELKDVKDYIEGAKEIVEAKKDELEDGCDGDDCGDKGDDDKKDEAPSEDAKESFIGALESFMTDRGYEQYQKANQPKPYLFD